MGELAEARSGTACEAKDANAARHMVDALTYLIGVASDSGFVRVATSLRSARSDLMLHEVEYVDDGSAMRKSA